jgi:hypothetical protein
LEWQAGDVYYYTVYESVSETGARRTEKPGSNKETIFYCGMQKIHKRCGQGQSVPVLHTKA